MEVHEEYICTKQTLLKGHLVYSRLECKPGDRVKLIKQFTGSLLLVYKGLQVTCPVDSWDNFKKV